MKLTCFIPFLFMIRAVSGQSTGIGAKQLIDTTGQHIVNLREITITHSGVAGAGRAPSIIPNISTAGTSSASSSCP